MRQQVASFIAHLVLLSLLLNLTFCQKMSSVEQIFANQGKLSQELDDIVSKVKKNNSIIFVMGDTGSGKSTLINYLIGNPLKLMQSSDKTFIIDTVNKSSVQIGHQSKSKTKLPTFAEDKEGNTFVDTAGFEDSQGAKVNIWNKLILKLILSKVQKKKVILVIEASSLKGTRGKLLKNSLLEIKHFFEQTVQNIAIVVSKSNCISNYREIISNILKEDDSSSSEEHRKFYKKITQKFKVLQFCQPSKEDYEQSCKNNLWNIEYRKDRKQILSALAELKEVKYSKLSVTFGGEEARMIESFIRQIKKEGEKKIKQFIQVILSESSKMSIQDLKVFRSKIVCTTSKKGPQFQQKQQILNWFYVCFRSLINQMTHLSSISSTKEIENILADIEKKVDIFSKLVQDVFITSEDKRDQKISLSFDEQIIESSISLKEKLYQLIDKKQKQQDLRKKEEEQRKKQQELKKAQEQLKRKEEEIRILKQSQNMGNLILGASLAGGPVGMAIAGVFGLLGRII